MPLLSGVPHRPNRKERALAKLKEFWQAPNPWDANKQAAQLPIHGDMPELFPGRVFCSTIAHACVQLSAV